MLLFLSFYNFSHIYCKAKDLQMGENKKIMVNVRIDSKLIEQYKKYCLNNGYSLSKRLRILIEKDLENGISL